MEIYKEKFTKLQREILRFLFINPSKEFNQSQIAKRLHVSSTAVAKSLPMLEKESHIIKTKPKEDIRNYIKLNRDNPKVFNFKRIENLKMLYESGLVDFLSENFKLSTIILFGSYSHGEDIESSDIDIAIISSKEKSLDLDKFEKTLEREISLQFYSSLRGIEINLRSNILNGVTLKGGVSL